MNAVSIRVLCLTGVLVAACGGWLSSSTAAQSLVSSEAAAPLGLERAWFAQVRVDNTRHRVQDWVLYRDNLLVQTTSGILHSLQAETGQTLWVAQAAPPDRSSTGPAANEDFVAVVSGATLNILDRSNGRLLWSRALGGAPAAAPTVTRQHAYVSFLSGRVEAYELADPHATVWYYQSIGRIFQSPSSSGETVSWPTSRGYLYVGLADTPQVMYRIRTDSPSVVPPTESGPLLLVTTQDGHLYCFRHANGQELWSFAMGFPATSRPAAVGERLYVASHEPMLYALDAQAGQLLWSTPGVNQFVAQGLRNVYGLDELGRLLVFDRETGKYQGRLSGEGYQAIFNEQSDRVLLMDSRGLVQCLREAGAVEPTLYRQEPAGETEGPADETNPLLAEPPATQPQPAFGEPPTEEPAASPFSVESTKESEESEESESPFSFGQ